jgi:hypothetical protein
MPLRLLGCLVAATAAVSLLGACAGREESLPRPSRAFCEAAYRYEQKIQKKPQPSIDDQISMVDAIATHAPKDIVADARVFLDAMRRVQTDPSVKDDTKVRTAVENVNRRTSRGCGFFEQERQTGL